jgi:hypothetical protein
MPSKAMVSVGIGFCSLSPGVHAASQGEADVIPVRRQDREKGDRTFEARLLICLPLAASLVVPIRSHQGDRSTSLSSICGVWC